MGIRYIMFPCMRRARIRNLLWRGRWCILGRMIIRRMWGLWRVLMHLRDIYINLVDRVGRIKSMFLCDGTDDSYLYQLAEALRELSPESKDRHVWDLEEKVRELEWNGTVNGEKDGHD